MRREKIRRLGVGGSSLAVALATGLVAANASAVSPVTLTIAPGIGGDATQNGGPGNEQPTVVSALDSAGVRHVVVIFMSSDVDPGQGLDPWQCKCSSIRLSPNAPPEVVVDRVPLTANKNTNRPCNHPFATTDGPDGKRIVWVHGHNVKGGNTQTYVQAIDAMCKPLSGPPVMISDNDSDANQGAPEVRFVSGNRFIGGYYYDGNNDDHTYARGLTLNDDGSISADFRTAAVNDNSIGRPAIATHKDRALVCASRGDNRPPEDGVACAWIDTTTGQALWSDKIIAASDPDKQIYMNQPSLASLGGGVFALQVIESTGQGKTANAKGVSKVHLYVLTPSDAVTDPQKSIQDHKYSPIFDLGIHQAHTAIISGKYGSSGQMYLGLFGSPITGSGLPVISFFHFDEVTFKLDSLDKSKDEWVVGANVGDSGKLANLYGANPGKQGRDFMRGVGDVPNPGAGIAGGFMSEVKSFFVLPYAGLRKGDEKNALFVSFVPGETSKPVVPEPPPPPPEPPPPQNTLTPENPSTCACALPGSSGLSGDWQWLLVGALSWAIRRRMRHA